MARKNPKDVFTPRTTVSREMFVRRNEPSSSGHQGVQERLQSALRDKGGQVLIYGDTGVGKTSLLKYTSEDDRIRFVTIDCLQDTPYEQLILSQLIGSRETKHTTSSKGNAGVGFGSTSAGGERGQESEFTVFGAPLIDAIVETMEQRKAQLLVLDNFHKLTDSQSRKMVADHIEILSNRANDTGNKKLVIVGIADDAKSLLGGDIPVTRRTQEVAVPRMADEEVREILQNGFGMLNLKADTRAINDMVFYSDGFPYFAHLLGLHVSLVAQERQLRHIADSSDVLRTALKRLLEEVEQSLRTGIELALHGRGSRVGRDQRYNMLTILARSDWAEWTSSQVIEQYGENFGPLERRANFFFDALNELTQEKFGVLLKRTKIQTHQYHYRFADPYARIILRIQFDVDGHFTKPV